MTTLRRATGIMPAFIILTVMLVLTVLVSGADSAGHQGVDRISVFVELRPASDRSAFRSFLKQHGGRVHYEYANTMPNTLNVRELPVQAVGALKKVSGVRSVVEDVYHEDLLQLDESMPLIGGLQSQIAAAGFSANGSDVRVCVIDTGVRKNHITYADRLDLAASWDFVNDDNDPEDDQGHGTHVAGTVLGRTGLVVNRGCEGEEAFQGTAPAATLIAMKVLDASGGGLDSDVAAALDRCVDPTLPGGPADVINLSLGGGAFSGPCDGLDMMANAANAAASAGAVVVAAAGNEGQANATVSPACASQVIAVGATYKDDYPNCENSQQHWSFCFDLFCFSFCTQDSPSADDLVCFSNNSTMIDVVAPGCSILSANLSSDTGLSEKCGTSMATPHVAGLAALLLDADPTATPAQIRAAIRDGAVDLGAAGFDPAFGYGRIDIAGSLSQLEPCAVDGDCDDAVFCNGVETCVAGECNAGSDPCPGEICDEGGVTCLLPLCNGNLVCELGEDCTSCPSDCQGSSGAVCGNLVCEPEAGEDCLSCPSDCNGKQNGKPSNRYCCGDGDGEGPADCSDSRCGGASACSSSGAAGSCCGDAECSDGSEDGFTCEVDCGPPPVCGDGVCEAEEIGCSCLADCLPPPEICGNGIDDNCDGLTDCEDIQCLFAPTCSCLPVGLLCSTDADCCTNKCKGNFVPTCR